MMWIQENGAYIQFFIQMAFYVVIAVCAVAATLTFGKLTAAKIDADNALIGLYEDAEDVSDCATVIVEDAPDVSRFVD